MSDAHDPIAACAEQVQKGDPDRFLATMTGDVEERKRLFPLYAFNLEIARAPFMSQEPMVAMIRLQFWRDVIEAAEDGNVAPRHDVATPLSQLLIWGDMRAAPLLRMIEAREGDVQGELPKGADATLRYIRETSGALMLAAGQLCGVTEFSGDYDRDRALEDLGVAHGLANWFLAQPALAKAGRGHVMPEDAQISALAAEGLQALARAKAELPRNGNPALRTAWRSAALLRLAARKPTTVRDGGLDTSEFSRRSGLLWRNIRGRW